LALALVNYGVDETTNPRLRKPRRRVSPTAPTPIAGVDVDIDAANTKEDAR